MLIFIENTPRDYAWGSRDALPEMLGIEPTGEPQAELWLGAHPGSPAHVAKATSAPRTLIDLIESDPERWGVDGGQLPFLLKVLAIGAPLSLQVHPDRDQARAGYAAEDAAGIPLEDPSRNYGDENHKPELLVALGEVMALSGFRDVSDARRDLTRLAAAARAAGDEAGADAIEACGDRLAGGDPAERRLDFLRWAFGKDPIVPAALAAICRVIGDGDPERAAAIADGCDDWDADRARALGALVAAHPADPGLLVSLLLHVVRLAPGEAIYLRPRQLHAYLGGVAVEAMAASDNVLRAGLTRKHVDIDELCRVVEPTELAEPRLFPIVLAPGLVAWRPDVPDFQLMRARLLEPEQDEWRRIGPGDAAEEVVVPAHRPIVLVVVSGRVRIERPSAALAEVATARRGQSLYVSAGEPIVLTGHGDVFLATVGA
ncbi:mannose-6-phosphate isomerase, class I [Leucobacter sp. CSA2]|uniref:mannose-6-phosphate isomerase n=1 Tax=Leucobacter edaphi TaxID=2796472 RepID=A0A934QD45_9MICO|nr:mannose-6-phosphate isomerase, class I [Leucobacter edaphi]